MPRPFRGGRPERSSGGFVTDGAAPPRSLWDSPTEILERPGGFDTRAVDVTLPGDASVEEILARHRRRTLHEVLAAEEGLHLLANGTESDEETGAITDMTGLHEVLADDTTVGDGAEDAIAVLTELSDEVIAPPASPEPEPVAPATSALLRRAPPPSGRTAPPSAGTAPPVAAQTPAPRARPTVAPPPPVSPARPVVGDDPFLRLVASRRSFVIDGDDQPDPPWWRKPLSLFRSRGAALALFALSAAWATARADIWS